MSGVRCCGREVPVGILLATALFVSVLTYLAYSVSPDAGAMLVVYAVFLLGVYYFSLAFGLSDFRSVVNVVAVYFSSVLTMYFVLPAFVSAIIYLPMFFAVDFFFDRFLD